MILGFPLRMRGCAARRPTLALLVLLAAVGGFGCGGHEPDAGRAAGGAALARANTPRPAPARSDAAHVRPAASAAAFDLPTIAGGRLSLVSLKGKVVLLDFWGTWCIPCRHELPDMEQLYNRYRKQGLVVLGMTETSPAADVKQVRQSLHLTFPMVTCTDAVAQSYGAGPEGLPVAVLLDRRGNIAGRMAGLDPSKPVARTWSPLIEKAIRS